jgi:hypothetical protein
VNLLKNLAQYAGLVIESRYLVVSISKSSNAGKDVEAR